MEKDVKKLLALLKEAVENLRVNGEGYSDRFSNVESFLSEINIVMDSLNAGDLAGIRELLLWFSPTNDWDDFDGDEELGDQIFDILLDLTE